MQHRQRQFIVIALSLILISSIAGAVFAFVVEQETLLKLREQYETAFVAAARDDMETAGAALEEAEKMNFRYVRVIDAHTHIIKLATLLLLFSLLLPHLRWQNRTQTRLAVAMATGAAVFPLSVFMQIYLPGFVFQAGAALGALLIIASVAMLVGALFRSTARGR